MSGSSAAVTAEDLVKIYPGGVRAVDGISFTVAPGEAFGLLGPKGAGKTTTIGMLNSAVRPTSGVATLGARDVARDPLGTRAVSSAVFQDAVVDLPLTGRHNLEPPATAPTVVIAWYAIATAALALVCAAMRDHWHRCLRNVQRHPPPQRNPS